MPVVWHGGAQTGDNPQEKSPALRPQDLGGTELRLGGGGSEWPPGVIGVLGKFG